MELEERTRQSAVKEKYGNKPFEHLIVKLDGELIDLYGRRDRGENVDLAIRMKEERKYVVPFEDIKKQNQIDNKTSICA